MKRLLLCALVAGALVAPAAQAADPIVVTETIPLPGPTSKAIGGITEVTTPCLGVMPDAPEAGVLPTQGLDGFWVPIPVEATGRDATLKSDGVDVDVWFYDESCGLISEADEPGAYAMATDLTADEAGKIPVTAAWAIVDNAVGVNVTFVFTIN